MRPKSGTIVYRPDLGGYVFELVENRERDFIGAQVMPLYEVDEPSGTFPVIPLEVMFEKRETRRAPSAAYERGQWEHEAGKYDCAEHGWEEPLDDGERAKLDLRAPGLADQVATERAIAHILRNHEAAVASAVFNATNFTANAVTNEWDDLTNATAIDDVNDAILSMNMEPDALIVAKSTYHKLRRHAKIIDQVKYTFPGIDLSQVNEQILAQVLNVPRLLVGRGFYYTEAGTKTYYWNNEYAALVKISDGVDIRQPGVGRTFLWTQDTPDVPTIEMYREEQIRSDIIRARLYYDPRLIQSFNTSGTVVSNVAQQCVYLFSNITT